MRFLYIGIFSEWSWLSLYPESRISVGMWQFLKILRIILIGSGHLSPARFTLRGPLFLHEWPQMLSFLALHSNSPSCMDCAKAMLQNIYPYYVAFLAAVSVLFFIVGSGDSPLEDDEVGYSYTRYKGECFACVLMRTCWCQETFSFWPHGADYNKVTRQHIKVLITCPEKEFKINTHMLLSKK